MTCRGNVGREFECNRCRDQRMKRNRDDPDPWSYTLGVLTVLSRVEKAPEVQMKHASARIKPTQPGSPPASFECLHQNPSVRVLDRLDAHTVTLAWSDATSCCYGEQTWRVRCASRPGVCAVSGLRIRRGDHVYKPAVRPRPVNANAMILSSVMLELIGSGNVAAIVEG